MIRIYIYILEKGVAASEGYRNILGRLFKENSFGTEGSFWKHTCDGLIFQITSHELEATPQTPLLIREEEIECVLTCMQQ